MNEKFLSNETPERFIDRLKDCFRRCSAFDLTVSFIKEAGLSLIRESMEDALSRGAKGRIITSTYQNFTDIPSLKTFHQWMQQYPNFSCHLDIECFGERGFHSKGYLFLIDGEMEFLVGSTNITRFALLKNIEWNVSLRKGVEDPIVTEAQREFERLYGSTLELDDTLIARYEDMLNYAVSRWDMDFDVTYDERQAKPNTMQKRALRELQRYRDMGLKKALVIAATASGKTYLSAFDARNFDAKRLLFIVHRDTILEAAKLTFEKVFLSRRTYGMYRGGNQDLECDFLFASTAMLSTHLDAFDPEEFDYIIFDECHHITASSYQKIYNYFKPRFLLGLTATPERMDNEDVFAMFDRNVPFELRLRDALLNDLVVPFEYYGIRDEFVDYSLKEQIHFLSQYFKEGHSQFIINAIESHRVPGKLKAIAFCRSIEHANAMAQAFSQGGYTAISINGSAKTGARLKAFADLQKDDEPLEIICTVDILNEGVDIPGVNMVLFLRPTESSTIFIQQLGRGLRKFEGKNKLIVLDFIGNSYDRSVQIGLALGEITNSVCTEKVAIQKLVTGETPIDIPGIKIEFDQKSKDEILRFIESTNFNKLSFLTQDYFNFKKYLLSETFPRHIDYLESDASPDLMRFIRAPIKNKRSGSYYNFLRAIDEDVPAFTEEEIHYLELISSELPLTRKEEFLIIDGLLNNNVDEEAWINSSARITHQTIASAYGNLLYRHLIVERDDGYALPFSNPSIGFTDFVKDILLYGLERYEVEFGDFTGPFKLYGNYAKAKVLLELTGKEQTYMAGTKFDTENHITYLFVGIKKDEVDKGLFAYKDKFLSPTVFQWESRNDTTFQNSEGKKLLSTKVVHLFIRKMEQEDGITLPFTYFGTGKFENPRVSENAGKPTLLFDVKLDTEVPVEYRFDFQIPSEN